MNRRRHDESYLPLFAVGLFGLAAFLLLYIVL